MQTDRQTQKNDVHPCLDFRVALPLVFFPQYVLLLLYLHHFEPPQLGGTRLGCLTDKTSSTQ
jgi:hypothetical protein